MRGDAIELQHHQVLSKIWPQSQQLSSQIYIHQNLEKLFSQPHLGKWEVVDIGCGH